MARRAVVLAITVAALTTASCAAGATPQAAPGSAAVTPGQTGAPTTYPPYVKPTLPPPDPAHLRAVPPDAVLGTAYPVDLSAHCGIDVIPIAGAAWRALQPIDVNGMPSIVTGTITLLDADTALLVIDQHYYTSRAEVVIYHRTAEELPRCA
jgi:hypothetical protein